ncbi:MAG: sporulation integral membrane protein YtvI [Clostridia bacterium]|nr:sporulation integral membrane protein YtvI [Clostridia bacterium]
MEVRTSAWQERAARLFVFLAVAGIVYLLFARVLWLLMPFLLALLLSAAVRPIAAFLERKWRVPHRVGAILLLFLLLGLFVTLVTLICRRVVTELGRLTDYVSGGGELLGARIEQALEVLSGLTEHIPFLSRLKTRESLSDLWAQVDAKLVEIISDTLGRLSAKIPEVLTGILRSVPSALIFLVTFLLAAYYLCVDADKIASALVAYLPARLRERIPTVKARLARLGGRYLRAYFLLFLMTFTELFLGFSILGLPYTFLPALVISVVDILPVLGVGTVLVPWGLIELLRGNVALGTGLLILCGVVLLVRQIAEPRIIGGSLGLHPLATLLAAYVGLRLFGLVGVLFGPAAAMVIKSVLVEGERM